MQIGDSVIYVDPVAVEHDAIVTATFGPFGEGEDAMPSVNVVYVSKDENETDQYGRQIKRDCSIPHRNQQGAHGRYWKE